MFAASGMQTITWSMVAEPAEWGGLMLEDSKPPMNPVTEHHRGRVQVHLEDVFIKKENCNKYLFLR